MLLYAKPTINPLLTGVNMKKTANEIADAMEWQIKFAPCDLPKIKKLMLDGAREIKKQRKEIRKLIKLFTESNQQGSK